MNYLTLIHSEVEGAVNATDRDSLVGHILELKQMLNRHKTGQFTQNTFIQLIERALGENVHINKRRGKYHLSSLTTKHPIRIRFYESSSLIGVVIRYLKDFNPIFHSKATLAA